VKLLCCLRILDIAGADNGHTSSIRYYPQSALIIRQLHLVTEDSSSLCLLKMLPVIACKADCIQHSMTQLLIMSVNLSALCSHCLWLFWLTAFCCCKLREYPRWSGKVIVVVYISRLLSRLNDNLFIDFKTLYSINPRRCLVSVVFFWDWKIKFHGHWTKKSII